MITLRRTCTWMGIVSLAIVLAACGGEAESTPDAASTADSAMSAPMASQAADSAKLNLNTATEEEFLTIPNVGDQMVHEFFEYRPYVSIQQFRREIGKYVDEEQVAAYEQYVFVPVDPNESDAATLQQLPGIDAMEAEELVAARPFDSNEAFLGQLGSYISAEELTQAESYLSTQ